MKLNFNFFALFIFISFKTFAGMDADKIVAEADLKRGMGNIPHQIEVDITNNQDNKIEKYLVKFKDVKTSLIIQTAPERAKGRKILLNDYDMWLFTPNIKRPVRISMDQKLTGEVANGDIANTNYASDYNASLVKIQTIENKDYYELELNAKNKKVTYSKINYLVDKKTLSPFEATFYALSGKPLKKAKFTDFKKINGIERSTKMIIYDYLKNDKYSSVKFSQHKEQKFPESIFNKDRLEFE